MIKESSYNPSFYFNHGVGIPLSVYGIQLRFSTGTGCPDMNVGDDLILLYVRTRFIIPYGYESPESRVFMSGNPGRIDELSPVRMTKTPSL